MDPFQQSITLSMGRTNHKICLVWATAPFLAAQVNKQAFCLYVAMTRYKMFRSALDRILTQLHLNKEHFNICGSRIGAATSAKQAGMFDIHMKMLGRWRSNVYLGYG